MPQAKDMNARGILLMILSMVAFAVADALVKVAGAFLSPAQVLFFLNAGGLILFALLAVIRGEPLWDRRVFAPILILRYVSEVIGMTGMVMALVYVPLSTVGAVTQAAPMLVAVLAVLFFGETVGWRRWSAIAVGFVGVLLVVQPSSDGFDISILWAVMAMIGLSVRDLITRLTPEGMPSTALGSYTMIAATPFALSWVLYNGEVPVPAGVDWIVAVPMVSLGALGYLLLITSIRMADVSVVTPFRYSRIIFLLALGVFMFDEKPNAVMLTGAALIIASGIYLILRQRKVQMEADAD